MEWSSVVCLIVCVTLNWGSSAFIVWKIQKIEKMKGKKGEQTC